MKQCTTCKGEKPLDQFHRRGKSLDGRSMTCKSCKKDQDQRRYVKHGEKHRKHVKAKRLDQTVVNRAWVVKFLADHPCVDCGEADLVVLEFDHVRGVKRGNVSNMITRGYSLPSVQSEIAKCEVRCANCHRRKTARDQGWDKLYDTT